MRLPALLLMLLCGPLWAVFASAATPTPPTTVNITSDAAVVVKPTVRAGSTSKTITITVNKADTVLQNGRQLYPVLPPPDHTGSGPIIDNSKIPAPTVGYSDARWQSIPVPCLVANPDPTQCAVGVFIAYHSDIGAFRVPCAPAKYMRDDPIVLPGQPGASHLHAFYGNIGVNAASTQQTLSTTGNSSCAGGTLVRSALWVPAVIDETGAPVAFDMNYYQKGNYNGVDPKDYHEIPAGLRMVVGNAKNTDVNAGSMRFSCDSNGWWNTFTKAIAAGGCVVGKPIFLNINFPTCWDGVNLDSPDHRSHVIGFEQYDAGGGNFPWRCPADHPVLLPSISYQLSHVLTSTDHPDLWWLASDMDLTKPEKGYSGHADYWANVDPELEKTITQWCLRESRDGHDFLTCDGRMLY